MPKDETITPVKAEAQAPAEDPIPKPLKAKEAKARRVKDTEDPATPVVCLDFPRPFRPRHLTAMIKQHAAAVGKKPEEIDPFQFIREHGTPNPVRRYRVTGTHGQDQGRPMEFDAVDPTDATNQYITARDIEEAHTWHFEHAVMDE